VKYNINLGLPVSNIDRVDRDRLLEGEVEVGIILYVICVAKARWVPIMAPTATRSVV